MTSAAPVGVHDAEVGVRAAEHLRCTALAGLDLAALDALFDPGLVHVHSNGRVHDKAELLKHIEARGSGVVVERAALHVRVMGDVAVMVGPIANHTVRCDGTTDVLTGVVTQVLKRNGSRWQFVSFQFTACAP